MSNHPRVYSPLGLTALAAAFVFGMSGTPINYQKQEEHQKKSGQPAIVLRAVDSDTCSEQKLAAEKAGLSEKYSIVEKDGNIYLRPRDVDDKEFVFDVYQRFTDFSNSSGGVLACYDVFATYRMPNTDCNIEISPCRKKAVKEIAIQYSISPPS